MKTSRGIKKHTKIPLFRALSTALALVLILCSAGCEGPRERTFFAMDTFMRVRVYGGSEDAAGSAEDTVLALSDLLSVTDERSELYALNHAGGKACAVSPETFDIIKRGLELSEKLGPGFELTLRPVSRAWGFTGGEQRIPESPELEALLMLVDDGRVELDEAALTVRMPEGFELDLGAAAKGYAADAAAKALKEAGADAALLDLGSSTILAFGRKPDGSRWKVALKDPNGGAEPAGIVEFTEGALSTSGGLERYFEGPDGTLYWHILDPATGAPARTGVLSVTVLTDEAFYGDALSTALFVMGPEKAKRFHEEHGDFEYIMFLEGGGTVISPGMEELFTPGA